MRYVLAILIFIAAAGDLFAQTKDPKSCAVITDSLQRLNCYDGIFRSNPSAVVQNQNSETALTFVDFITDFNDLVGRDVKVDGFGLILGENLIIYKEMGSLNGAFVNIEKIPRDNKRELMNKCGSGCNVTVSGVARKVLLHPGIVARSIAIGH